MILKRGITGFTDTKSDPLPMCDLSDFKSFCYAAARAVDCQVTFNDVHQRETSSNFTFAVFGLPKGPIGTFLNLHYPVIAFAVPPTPGESCEFQFVDCKSLEDVFTQMGEYNLLSQADLDMPISEKEYGQLSAAEIQQVKYWKPKRIGEMIFNFWN